MSIHEIPNQVINIIKKFIKEFVKLGFEVKKVYLYGSYAKGDWLKSSDIDIVIISNSVKNIPFKDRLEICWKITYKLNLNPPIEALVYTEDELTRELGRLGFIKSISKYWLDITSYVKDC